MTRRSPEHQGTAARWAWVLYDFANSSYTTLIITFIYATYFTTRIIPDPAEGTALWANAITLSALAVALLAPPLGRIADALGYTKRLLIVTTLICVTGTALLFPLGSDDRYLILWLIILTNIAFELGNVFYNALLPRLSTPDRIGRISGIGWGVGYFGGLLALGIALAGFVARENPWFGFTTLDGENIRATCLLVSLWFLLFSLPLFFLVPESPPVERARQPFLAACKAIGSYPQAMKLLLARLFYNDGLVTIFSFGGIYAAGTFGFSFAEILVFGIVLNLAAGAGALIMGWADDRFGGKRVIMISIAVLTIATLLAAGAPNRALIWTAGILIGLFAGPAQSASRSLFARFTPEHKESLFFGLFAFSGKLTAFAGPLLLGQVTLLTGSQRWGVLTIVLFFAIGISLLMTVDEAQGIKDRDSLP